MTFYRLFTFFAHDAMQAPGDSVTFGVTHAFSRMRREDIEALRDNAKRFVERCETELSDRQTER